MKDYIVFFTEGFDDYTVEKQRKVFPHAHISCIPSKPDYNTLINESKKAIDGHFDNFYIFWEREDTPSMNFEMAKEFKSKFKETGAIPYKYDKLIEQDVQQPNPAAVNQTPGAVPATPNPAGTSAPVQPATQPAAQPGVQQQTQPGQVVQGDDPNVVNSQTLYNTRYSKEHTATVFIWPFNLFLTESWAMNAFTTFGKAVSDDTMSHSSDGTITATMIHSKKGTWQRLIYIPQSLEALGQGVARGDTMYKFTRDTFQNYPFAGSKIGQAFAREIERNALGRAGVKVEFGLLTEADIINACRRSGAKNATIRNIKIIYPKVYLPFLKWCPEESRSEMTAVNYPSVEHNKAQLAGLEKMKQFVYEKKNDRNYLNAIAHLLQVELPEDITEIKNQPANIRREQAAAYSLRKLISNLEHYNTFWTYWNLYLSQNDVYGRPDGTGDPNKGYKKFTNNLSDFLDDWKKTTGNKHTNDMDKIYQMAGWLPKGMSTDEFGLFGGKYLASELKRGLDNFDAVKSNAAKVANMLRGSGKQPEVKPEDNTPVQVYDIDRGDKAATIKNENPDGKDEEKNKPNAQAEEKTGNTPENKEADKDNTKVDNKEQSDKEKAAEKPAENKSEDEKAEGEENNAPQANNAPQLNDVLVDRILCQLSDQWTVNENGVSWIGHNFFSDYVAKGMEAAQDNEENKVLGIQFYTSDRARIIREYIANSQVVNVDQPNADNNTQNTNAATNNQATQNNQQAPKPAAPANSEIEKEKKALGEITVGRSST